MEKLNKIKMEIFKDIVGNYWKNAVILILLLVISCSCGVRKVQNTKIKEEVKAEQTAKITNDIETKIIENNESQEIEITPIDTSKVLIINGKSYKNAKVKFSKIKSEIKTDIKDKSKSENKTLTATKKQTKLKAIEKKTVSFWWLLLLIPIVIYIYAKSKD